MSETAVRQFDDRIDVETEISSIGSLTLIGRSFKLLLEVKKLFALRFLLKFGMLIPVLFMPWIGKIMTDNVLLQQPFGQRRFVIRPLSLTLLAWNRCRSC